MPGRPTAMPACRRRARRARDALGAEQPRRADPGRRDRARPHGRRAAGAARRARCRASPAVAVDVAELLPGLHWPAQIEFRAGRHVVRPRYEVIAGRPHPHRARECRARRPAARPRHPGAANLLGRGYLLPFPVLPPRPLPHHRAADADGGDARPTCRSGSTCSTPTAASAASASSAACRATTTSRSTSTSSTPTADMPSWSMISATAASADGWLHALVRYEDRRQRPRGGDQLRRAYLQHADDLSGRAAILFRPAARPLDAAVPQARRRRAAQLRCT